MSGHSSVMGRGAIISLTMVDLERGEVAPVGILYVAWDDECGSLGMGVPCSDPSDSGRVGNVQVGSQAPILDSRGRPQGDGCPSVKDEPNRVIILSMHV